MPVSPATVREAFVPDEPVARDVPTGQAAGGVEEEHPHGARTRRALLISACVAAFLVGFASVTLVMRGADSSTKRTKSTPTTAESGAAGAQAPAPSSPTRAALPVPPSSGLVADQGGAASQASPPAPAPMPRTGNAGGPVPSTAPPPTTSSATTTPPTTAP